MKKLLILICSLYMVNSSAKGGGGFGGAHVSISSAHPIVIEPVARTSIVSRSIPVSKTAINAKPLEKENLQVKPMSYPLWMHPNNESSVKKLNN